MIRLARCGLFGSGLLLALIWLSLTWGAQLPRRQILYTARVAGDLDIFLLDVNTHLTRNLTNRPGDDSRPAWSPDGRYIVFESWRAGTRAIYVMDALGGDMRRLTADARSSEYDPQWTEDGESILFRSYKRNATGEAEVGIYRVAPDGTGLEATAAGSGFRQSSGDAPAITVEFQDGAWGLHITEGDKTRPVPHNNAVLPREAPQWLAAERWVAFLSQSEVAASEIYVMDVEGRLFEQMTTDGTAKSHLSWRP
jgi:TolB protein